ncbi:MAG: hypothetical protein R3C14_39105 [Caldilineaceae bacterium]
MLLIHAKNDRHSIYSHYLAEILRLEGFADFAEAELTALDAAALAQHDLVILPRCATTAGQAEQLQHYVIQGGRLIAFLPDPYLARRFGLTPTWRGIDNGWLHAAKTLPIWQGLCCEPMQIITPAVGWQIAEGTAVQLLAHVHATSDPADPANQPGIAWCQVGAGDALCFAYDLPHAIARLRQGDPAHADLSYAGLDGIVRPSELFVGQLAVAQMLLPQADIQTALLARLIETLAPRPRLWYYPEISQQSVVIMTSDDDWSTHEQFDALLAGLRRFHATCTFYVVPETKLTLELIEQWEAEGHTFSVHPALAGDIRSMLAKDEPQATQVEGMLRENVARHVAQLGRTPRTIRQHAIRWLGYVDAARILAELGVEMELNYLSVHPFSLGYMAGSGRPLPFVDTDGALIPCYQQPTLWTEEVLIHPRFVFSFKWTVEEALEIVGKIIQRAAHEFYTPITFNSHPVSFATYSSPLIEGTWQLALAAGMTIISADHWLDWTLARNGVRTELTAEGCIVHALHAMPALTLLLPPNLTVVGRGVASTQVDRWGRQYTAATLHDLAAGEKRQIGW